MEINYEIVGTYLIKKGAEHCISISLTAKFSQSYSILTVSFMNPANRDSVGLNSSSTKAMCDPHSPKW